MRHISTYYAGGRYEMSLVSSLLPTGQTALMLFLSFFFTNMTDQSWRVDGGHFGLALHLLSGGLLGALTLLTLWNSDHELYDFFRRLVGADHVKTE